jgi:AcrR family transcriptional regulator
MGSKQELLAEIVIGNSDQVLADFDAVVQGVTAVPQRLQGAVEAYALRHATHPREALITNREVFSLEEPVRTVALTKHRRHERAIRQLIAEGAAQGLFTVDTPVLASFAILEMCVSIARWFRAEGPLEAARVASEYSQFAMRIVGWNGGGF